MELQHLRAFYEVARRGSISAAAQGLRLTQPSVSRAVQGLERGLGVTLFERKPRGVVLTEHGQRVYRSCLRIFQEYEALKSGSAPAERRLRIAASENLCIHLIPRLLEGRSAGLSLELTSGTAEEIIRTVVNGEADTGYCYHPSKAPGLACSPFSPVEFHLVARARLRGKLSLRELKDQAFIGSISKDYSGVPYAAKSLLAEAGLSAVEARFQCNSQEAQLSMVEAGLGFTLVPWFVAEAGIRKGTLTRVRTKQPLLAQTFKITRWGAPSTVPEIFELGLKQALSARVINHR